jgi:hypothetical protein
VIGRVKTPNLGLLWQVPKVTEAVLDGHCMLVPNDKRKLGYFGLGYSGDQCYIHHCLRPYTDIAWTDRIWTLTRPEWNLIPMWASEGSCTWACDLYRGRGGVPFEKVATVLLEADDERDIFYATVNAHTPGLMVHEYKEIGEFLVYAGQSKDIWIKTRPAEGALALGLRQANFKEHARTDEFTEFTHDWPPDFWGPVAPFNETFDPDTGARHLDWRDAVWGRGRSNT